MEVAEKILYFTELLGIIAFAISGSIVAIEKGLDLFGVIVLGVTTSVGGGMFRDILLGILPPTMFTNPIYAILALIISLLAFIFAYFAREYIQNLKEYYTSIINLFDAIGVGVFSVMGVNTAISAGFGDNAFLSVFVGVITGVGGGVFRDIMSGRIPVILRKRIYALAALGGALIYYCMYLSDANKMTSLYVGIFLTIAVRLLATHYRWTLPSTGPIKLD